MEISGTGEGTVERASFLTDSEASISGDEGRLEPEPRR